MSAHTETSETADDRRRTEAAARYLIEQHGDAAVDEARLALRQANEIHDEMAVKAFEAILALLEALHSGT